MKEARSKGLESRLSEAFGLGAQAEMVLKPDRGSMTSDRRDQVQIICAWRSDVRPFLGHLSKDSNWNLGALRDMP